MYIYFIAKKCKFLKVDRGIYFRSCVLKLTDITKQKLIETKLSMKDVILGILDTDNSIYNFVILHAKQYIYNARCNDHRLNVTAFKKQLKNIYTIEKYIAEKNDRVEEWQRKWNSINM